METNILRSMELQSLISRELSRGKQQPPDPTVLSVASADGSAYGMPVVPGRRQPTPEERATILQHIYSERSDLATLQADLASETRHALHDHQYESSITSTDPSQLAFACELLYQRIPDEPLLRSFFEHIDTERLHSMVNSAVCKCVYQDIVDAKFLKRIEHAHAQLDIRLVRRVPSLQPTLRELQSQHCLDLWHRLAVLRASP